jgi:prepilin-type N-terminal cleavage/methylation domain-containing protein
MKTDTGRTAGFTLTELMVVLAITSVFSAALYGAYVGQFKAHAIQNAVIDIQQDLRSSLYILQRSIRMAGFDPSLGVRNNNPSLWGIVPQFPSPHHYNGGVGPGTPIGADGKCQNLAFTMDTNGDQVDPGTGLIMFGGGTIEATDSEYIAFRLSGSTLQSYRPSSMDWVTVAENIESLDFEFLGEDDSNYKGAADADDDPDSFSVDRNGNGRPDIDDNGDGFPDSDMLALVRYVRVTLVGKRVSDLTALGGNKPAQTLSAMVEIRNRNH